MYDVEEKYTAPAVELAREIGRRGHTLIWGGSNGGLMKAVADAVQKSGGKIVGISVEFLRAKARGDADEMIYASDLPSRKQLLRERSDAIVVLPGGTGTLDEISEVFELKKHDMYSKPVAILNTNNFYEGLKIQLERMKKEGFITGSLDKYAYFAETPKEVLSYLEKTRT